MSGAYTVIALFDFIGDDTEVLWGVIDRAAKLRLAIVRRLAMSFIDQAFYINDCTHCLILDVSFVLRPQAKGM